MCPFLIELLSTDKSYTVQFKELALSSFFVKSFYMLLKQKLYSIQTYVIIYLKFADL